MSARDARLELGKALRVGSAADVAVAGDELASEAIRQGLAALVLDTFSWSPEARARLEGARLQTLIRNVRLLDLARRLEAALAATGVRALPMKGAALLAMGEVTRAPYRSEGDRAMADLDLLVLDEWRAAVAAVWAEGLTPLPAADHAQPFADKATGVTVELHVATVSCPGLFPQDTAALWARSKLGGRYLHRVPSPEDLLVQLALHAAFQHGLVLRLGQWLDFRRLLECGTADAGRLLAIADASGAAPALWAALEAARRVVAAPVPSDLARQLERRAPAGLRRWLARRDALDLVAPARPRLARVRLGLVPARRMRLVALTLSAQRPGETIGASGLVLRGLRRAVDLGWRFGVESSARLVERVRRGTAPRERHVDSSRVGVTGAPAAHALLQGCLEEFPLASLSVTGSCMEPALRAGEKVLLARREPRVGDIVLTRSVEGLRLHRLVLAMPPTLGGTGWRTKADRALLFDPAIGRSDVLATAVGVEGRSGALTSRRRALVSLAEGVWWRLRGVQAA